jgi:23S rRNA (uracil1939-C5)-methyltransferase
MTDAISDMLNELSARFPEIVSVFYVINTKVNDSMSDLNPVLFSGDEYITEEMEGLVFRISPKSFFQTNTMQALELYRTVRDFAGLTGNETVYDLYTGTGTIALFLSRHCNKVFGMDFVDEAIRDARLNSEANNIKNAKFYSGDVRKMLEDGFVSSHSVPDVIVTDPPRAGMHEIVVESLNRLLPPKIVYVSCNSATQARDINLLSDHYRIARVQAVDMFPHTYHIENVVLLERR